MAHKVEKMCPAMVLLVLILFVAACAPQGPKAAGVAASGDDEPGGSSSLGDDDTDSGGDDDIVLDDDTAAADDDIGVADDDDVADDDTAGDDDDDICPNSFCIYESEDLGADWSCDEPTGGSCLADYENFLKVAADFAAPISDDELWARITEIEDGGETALTGPMAEEDLAAALAEGLNIGFLLDGLDTRPLYVTTVAESAAEDYYSRTLLFTDRYVGTFRAVMLTPKTNGPHPGVVGVHGHAQDAEMFMTEDYGELYPAEGYTVLAPTLRVLGGGVNEESWLAEELLLDGFTTEAVHMYEVLLCIKYLRYVEDIGPERIGLVGHSFGSGLVNLMLRLFPDLGGGVTDLFNSYLELTNDGDLTASTTPQIWQYHGLVNDFTTAIVPSLKVPYGYYDEIEQYSYMPMVFRFLKQHVK